MLLSRLGAHTTIRREFLKRTPVSTLLPRTGTFTKFRTFKSTIKLYEEELPKTVKVCKGVGEGRER